MWAPEAKAVSVVGDFNDWQAARNPMRYLEATGIYELFVPGVNAGDLYKYEIWGADGKRVMKAESVRQLCRASSGDGKYCMGFE